MTVAIIVAGNNGILAYADGAAYDDDGRLGQFKSKCRIITHNDALVFGRGSGFASDFAKDYLARCNGYDEMVEALPKALRLSSEAGQVICGEPVNLGLVIAGFSVSAEKWCIHHGIVYLEPDGSFGEGSFVVNQDDVVHFSRWPSIEALSANGLSYEEGGDLWDVTSDENAVRFLEALRQTPVRLHPGTNEIMGCNCGGFIERFAVNHGVGSQIIIHRWPDKIGEKLNAGAA